jgi:predicted phosphodiesterase
MRLVAVALLLFASRAYAAESPAAPQGDGLAVVHGPYLIAPRADSMTVVWFTNQQCLAWVEYGENGDLSKKAFGMHFGLIDALDTRHAVEIRGLESGKTYSYRVVAKEIKKFAPYKVDYGAEVSGKTFHFTTCDPRKQSFSFCAVSDIHGRAKEFDAMLQQVRWDGVDFVALDGDMISDFCQESQVFDGFLDTCVARFATATPMVYVRGNHETRGGLARRFFDYVPTPEGRFYGSFNHGGVHFIVLDSGEDKTDSSVEYSGLAAFDPYREEQARWLRDDLRSEASRNATFRIALFHMPMAADDKWHGPDHLNQIWRPLFNEGNVDLAICGHIHKATHSARGDGGNTFDVATCSPTSMIRVDVAPERLAVAWQGIDAKERLPEAFSRDAEHRAGGAN